MVKSTKFGTFVMLTGSFDV